MEATDRTGLQHGEPNRNYPINVVGGTDWERKAIRDAIGIIRNTKTGKRLLEPYDPGGNSNLTITIGVSKLKPHDPVFSVGPASDVPKDPKRIGRAEPPGDVHIYIQPGVIHNPNDPGIWGGPLPAIADVPILLVHELGHGNGYKDDGPGGMNNTKFNENPFRAEHGYPARPLY